MPYFQKHGALFPGIKAKWENFFCHVKEDMKVRRSNVELILFEKGRIAVLVQGSTLTFPRYF